jgi:DNA polymerase I
MNRLLVLDGNALLHRAYHAMPPLTSPDGKPTGAVYGFVSMLIRLQTDLNSSHFAVTFDRHAPTFRNKLYKEYQSQRPPMDELLVSQVTTVHEVIEEMNIPIYEVDGYEADDVIGTIVEQFNTNKLSTKEHSIDQIIIVTGDRDILQLVIDDKVLVYMPVKGLSEAKLYGEKDVIERLGIAPQRIPDWKGLCGDPSDNYPGVKGIGPKTATDLINKYVTVEEVYKAVEKDDPTINKNVKLKLINDKEAAFLSKNLATIRLDAPISVSPKDMYIPTFDTEETKRVLLSLGFPSLVKRLTTHSKAKITEQKSEEIKVKKEKKDNQLDLFS